MDEDKASREADQWRQKYFRNLEDLEKKEKQWREAEELLRRTISRLTLAADGLDEMLDGQLRALRDAIRDRVNNATLKEHIEAMSRTLVRLDLEHQGSGREKSDDGGLFSRFFRRGRGARESGTGNLQRGAKAESDVSVRAVLLELLQRLNLPEELEARAARLREQLEAGDPPQGWEAVIDEIAELVTELRQRSQQERKGIEEFLSKISERLQEVGRHLQGSSALNDDNLHSGRALGDAVRREMEGIESSVRQADNIDQLKGAVQQRLDAVLVHLSRHSDEQQLRYEKAKQQIESMSQRVRALEKETRSLRSRVNEERSQAMTDALTQIPNRLAWQERVEQEVARWKRFGTPLVLLFWDVDHFKDINDSYGHKAGDKVLRKLAGVLHAGVRETDFVARYGGEEFAMLMTGSDLDTSLEVADKLRKSIENTGFHFRGQAVPITMSCGLTQFRNGDTVEQALERADRAMYQAKRQGRNRCVCA